MRATKWLFTAVALLLATAGPGAEETKDMHQPDLKYRWNLADIYATPQAWREAKTEVAGRLDSLTACEGHLGDSAASLLGCLDTFFNAAKDLRRVMAYASMLSDEDTRESPPLEMKQESSLLANRFSQAAAFVQPELLAVGEERIRSFLAAEPLLAPYQQHLEDILRRAPHTLGEEAEQVIAIAGLMSDTPSSAYGILANADIPWPTVTLSDGTQARLDQAGYSRYRSVGERTDRRQVFDTFFGTWQSYARTCGVTLYSQMKRDMFFAQARHYPTTLAAALDADNVPEAVYHQLVDSTNANLDTLHRYLRLRGRMLGIDDLRYYDIYPPLVGTDREFDIETAYQLILASLGPLGDEYVAAVRGGFDNRWMDVYPQQGKRSGAYSAGSVYDVHPFVLMNYNDDYESVSTLTHEFGHAMHSYLANRAQPYPTADYSIFVAEVASTFNEALLLDHVLETAASDEERLFYLGSALEGLRGTFFRQAMFAEFELAIHRAVERGEALSGDRLSQMYGEILRRYHGQEQGVLTVDDAYTVEWAYIPHFYYNYYVYQYATSIAAASLFAERVLSGEAGAAEAYLDVLRSGGSEYPYELLKTNGVDLADPAPYQALMVRMNRIMDDIETILDKPAAAAAR